MLHNSEAPARMRAVCIKHTLLGSKAHRPPRGEQGHGHCLPVDDEAHDLVGALQDAVLQGSGAVSATNAVTRTLHWAILAATGCGQRFRHTTAWLHSESCPASCLQHHAALPFKIVLPAPKRRCSCSLQPSGQCSCAPHSPPAGRACIAQWDILAGSWGAGTARTRWLSERICNCRTACIQSLVRMRAATKPEPVPSNERQQALTHSRPAAAARCWPRQSRNQWRSAAGKPGKGTVHRLADGGPCRHGLRGVPKLGPTLSLVPLPRTHVSKGMAGKQHSQEPMEPPALQNTSHTHLSHGALQRLAA